MCCVDDPFCNARAVENREQPSWVKFAILTTDTTAVYFQDCRKYLFHYNFTAECLDPFLGLTIEEFNQISLYRAGQEVVLGAVLFPPNNAYGRSIREYGIQLVGSDCASKKVRPR